MTDLLVAVAYVNWGRWVADCPRPFCWNAEHLGYYEGEFGGLTEAGFACRRCQTTYPARWPDAALRAGVEQLLVDRPDPRTRNWREPETLHDLLAENVEHGIAPAAALEGVAAGRGGAVLGITGDVVTLGARELVGGPQRLAIGGS